MKRREVLIGSGTIAATALAGCLGSGETNDNTGQSSGSSRTITVRKSGEAEAEPDLAVLRVGVKETGESANQVRENLAERSNKLKETLLDAGFTEEDITTGQFSIRKHVDRRQMEREGVDPSSQEKAEEYTNYEGTHSLTVEVQPVEEVGAVIDTVADAGADEIGRIRFTLSDETRETLREQALDKALEKARSEAEFVADEIGATIVEAHTIDTSGGDVHPVHERVEMGDAASDASPRTEIHPDDVTVTATITVQYKME